MSICLWLGVCICPNLLKCTLKVVHCPAQIIPHEANQKQKKNCDKQLTVSHVQQQLGKVVIQASALKGAHSYHRTFDNCAWGECAVGLRTTLGKVLVA